ncbi:MAG TPA: hypothetical protein VGR64_02345, partial [Terracidiphilus sp.]|nr:hypothetical protein [Terracidiphilus sp.]
MRVDPRPNSGQALRHHQQKNHHDGRYFSEMLPELLFAAFLILFITIRLVQQHAAFLRAPGADWNSSEWMIDYADG